MEGILGLGLLGLRVRVRVRVRVRDSDLGVASSAGAVLLDGHLEELGAHRLHLLTRR